MTFATTYLGHILCQMLCKALCTHSCPLESLKQSYRVWDVFCSFRIETALRNLIFWLIRLVTKPADLDSLAGKAHSELLHHNLGFTCTPRR